jgi:hypothetical protein
VTTERKPEVVLAFFCKYLYGESSGLTTALGIYGVGCIITGSPPKMIDLAVHFSISNLETSPDQEVQVSITLPGQPAPVVVKALAGVRAKPDLIVNLNLPGLPVNEPGVIVATLDLAGVLHHEIRLPVEFTEG